MTEESLDDADRLGLLVDAVLLALEQGEAIDETALATRFRIEATVVTDCVAGLRAVHGYSWDFHDEGMSNAPDHKRPELPHDYELLEELGRGGMGVVYRARQHSLNREVAVKVLRPSDAFLERALQRFEKEARSLAQLRHPNVVTIYEVGRGDGQVYFTMDLIRGQSLHDLIRSDSLTPLQGLKIMRQVASAIAYTHEQGIIHRDLKPLNILLDEAGKPYVTDFGLARHLNDSIDLTRSGQVLGTPHYMSPEQARGEIDRIAEPSDVWGLGAILYECLCGQPPFPGTSPIAVLHDLVHKSPQRPSKIKRSAPPGLEAIALKALAKEPKDRYPTARAFLEDLERFEQGRSPRADISNPYLSLVAFGRRYSSTLLSGIVVAAVLLVTFAFTVLPRLGNDPETLRTLADQLWDEGSVEAAATAYESAQIDPLSPETMKRIVQGRLSQAHRLRKKGRPDEAVKVLEDLTPKCLLWIQEARSPAGSPPLSPWDAPFREMDCRAVDVELALAICEAQGKEAAKRFIPSFHIYSNWDDWLISKSALASELFPSLSESKSPLREWAIEILTTADSHRLKRSLFDLYPESRHELTLEVLARPELNLFENGDQIASVIGIVSPQTVEAALMLARDKNRSLEARSLLSTFLEVALELPRANPEMELRTEEEISALASLSQRVLASDPLDGFWQRCDEALRQVENGKSELRPWLAEMGFDPEDREDEELLNWWATLPHQSPVDSWQRRVGIPAQASIRDLYYYLDADNLLKARTAHRLLRWQQGSDASWPLMGSYHASNSELWESILLQDLKLDDNYVCHAAIFRIVDGVVESTATLVKTVPVLSHERSKAEAEELRIKFSTEGAERGVFRVPGFMDPQSESHLSTQGTIFRPALFWSEPQPVFATTVPNDTRKNFVRGLNWRGQWVERVVDPKPGVVFNSQDMLPLFLACSTSRREFDPTQLDDWRRAARINLKDCLVKLGSKDNLDASLIAPAFLSLLAQIGLPESTDLLKVFDVLLEKHGGTNPSFREFLWLGRLMSGDEEARRYFDEHPIPDHETCPQLAQASLYSLHHVALNSPSEESRRWAQKKLSREELSEELRALLLKAGKRRPFLSSELIEALKPKSNWSLTWERIIQFSPESFTLAAFLWLTVLISLVVACFKKRRLMGAGYLVVSGGFMAMFEIELEGVALVPGKAGWFVAALGAALLIPKIKSRYRFHALLVFLVTGFLAIGVRSGLTWLAFPLCFAEWSSALMLVFLCRLHDDEFDELRGHRLCGALPLASLVIGIPGLLVLTAVLGRSFGFEDLAFGLGSLLIMSLLFWSLMVMNRRYWTQPSILPRALMLSYFPFMLLLQSLSWVQVAAQGGHKNQSLVGPFSPWQGVAGASYLSFLAWLFLLASFGSFKKKRRPEGEARPLRL